MKKAIVILLALMMLAPMAFANAQAEEAKPVTIEFWTHEDANRQRLEERYIKEFCETHPNVTINVTRQAATKMIELVQTAFAAGQGPTVFNLSINDEYPYIVAGRVAPINYAAAGYKDAQAVIDAYAPGMLESVTYEGDVYGLPLELTNWCLFINKNVFRSAGLDPETDYPKTWEEVVEVSRSWFSAMETSSPAEALTSGIRITSSPWSRWWSSSADSFSARTARKPSLERMLG